MKIFNFIALLLNISFISITAHTAELSQTKPTEHQQQSSHTDHSDDEEQRVRDLFPGTVVLKNRQYILERCTSGGSEYVLDFSHDQQKTEIDELIKNKTRFWVNVFGDYDEINNEHHLKVRDISDIHLGQSCKVMDFLEILEQEQTE